MFQSATSQRDIQKALVFFFHLSSITIIAVRAINHTGLSCQTNFDEENDKKKVCLQ